MFTQYSVSVVRAYQSYTEPGDGPIATQGPLRGEVNPLHPPAPNPEEETVLPLGELALSGNLGIPIVVVVTKVGTPQYLQLYVFRLITNK